MVLPSSSYPDLISHLIYFATWLGGAIFSGGLTVFIRRFVGQGLYLVFIPVVSFSFCFVFALYFFYLAISDFAKLIG